MSSPDYRTPSPDDGHEAIRAPLADAIDRLECEIERIDDAYLLLLSTTDFAASTLRTVLGAQAAMASLSARIAALEAAAKPAPEPEPAPEPAPDPEPTPEPDPAPEPEPANDAPSEDLTDTEETP